MPLRRIGVVAAMLIVALTAAGAVLASGWTPTIPADAPSAEVGRASARGEMSPACLDRIERDTGWLDLCWDVNRQPDEDREKDYYVLRISGTLSGETGGVRWSALRARLVDAPAADSVFFGWPDGIIDGPCDVHDVSLPAWSRPSSEEICGRTSGEFVGPWTYRVTWACVGCVLPERGERPVALYYYVAVPEGMLPGWEIGADFGS